MKKNKIGFLLFSTLGVITALMFFSCRQDAAAARPKIEKIQFAESKKTMAVGERASVGVNITPKEARSGAKIEYSASVKDIVNIDVAASSSEGVVFTAVNPGSTVILARAQGTVDYCDITVTGDAEAVIPYISLTENVLEIPVGKKKYVMAALQGGTPSDQNNFNFINENDYYAYLEYANNTAVIEGLRAGMSKVTVTHPKAQYSVDVLAFVLNEGETTRYITGDNVVFMELGGGTKEYSIRLIGVDESNYNNTVYQVVEGGGVLEVINRAGTSCTLQAKTAGMAKVRVSNQSVEYPFEFQVVVRAAGDVKYIDVKNNFYIINDDEYVNFNAVMKGDAPSDYADKFSYLLNDEARNILEVQQTQDNFTVSGLKDGKAVLVIDNEYSDFQCEILFVVQNKKTLASESQLYIRTSQYVIQMEAGKGAPDALLIMELVGGTSADQGYFEWIVEDSSIIDVKAPGAVKYTRAQIDTQTSYEVQAVITAKKTGSTRITVKNEKAANDITVMVKVYPYGTFSGQTIYLSGPSLIKLKAGDETNIYTPVVGGNVSNTGLLEWKSLNTEIAEAHGSGLHGVVKGRDNVNGVTKLVVSGENIAQDFESVIVVYREGEENTIPYIYTDNLNYRLTVGQTVRVPIRHPNIANVRFDFSVYNTNKESVYHILNGDVLVISGCKEGNGEIVITANSPSECNNLTLYVTVESDKVDITKPYSLKGGNLLGTNVEGVVSYTIGLTGAGVSDLKNIIWSIEDNRVAKIKGISGDTVQIEGLAAGQTVLHVNHSKSVNEKTVIIYVVEKGQPLDGKIIIGIEKQNHVLLVNQSVFLKLVTNADENNKKLFKYKVTNSENIDVDFNYDMLVVTGMAEGNSKVTISCYDDVNNKKNLADLDIFITVKNELGLKAEIGFPDSIVLVKGKFSVVKGSAVGIGESGLNNVQYILEDASIADVVPNRLEAVLKGLKAGQTFMTVSCEQLSYFKKVLVICVENEAELDTLYYFTVPKTLYRIKKGDEIKVNLNFGENGAPPDGLYDWLNINNNNAVQISVQGNGALITGKNEGQAVIRITCSKLPDYKPVEIIVEVSGNLSGSDYYRFGFMSGIRQMRKGSVDTVPVSIYYGNEYYDDYDVLNPGVKLEHGYSGITVSVSDTSVLEAGMIRGDGQNLRISANKPGRAEITLSHPMIAEDAKILAVVYEEEALFNDEFIFFAPQKHFLINKGETKSIAIQTNTDMQTAQSKLFWTNNNQDLFDLDAGNRVEAQVTAVKEGSGTLTVRDSQGNSETVYVSVSGGGGSSNVSVATESIIVLSLEDYLNGNKNYTTGIIVSGGSQSGISWLSGDIDMLHVEGNGLTCLLRPQDIGLTYITVKGYGFEKTILVKIVATEEHKEFVRVFNVDQRHYKMKKGETVIINPYYKVIKPLSPVIAVPEYDNKVIRYEPHGSGLLVTAQNIGIEHLILSNNSSENEVSVVFEVDENITGGSGSVKNAAYMVTDNPVIILEPEWNDYYFNINIIGEYKGDEKDFIWSADSNKISVNGFGTNAFISSGKQEGQAVITIKNKYCEEDLKINVYVSKKYVQHESTEPYLYASRNVYTMNKSDSSLIIPLEIRNVGEVNYNNVFLHSTGHVFNCTFANGNIYVNPYDTGTGTIEVYYNDLSLKLYIIIHETSGNEAVFLTTAQNYVIVNENAVRGILADLINYEEIDSSKIIWKSADTRVAHVIGSGKAVQILGAGAGITKLTVSHYKAYNDLEILVKVLPSGSAEDICYLTTGENVIESYISTLTRRIQVAKVGGRQDVNAVWTVDNPAVAGVVGSNNTAYVTFKKAGSAKITVSDVEAGTLDIVVIVREAKPGSLFIYPDSNIVQVTPGSSNGVIGVSLPGIDESEEKNFKWEIFSQLPSDIDVARGGGSVVSIYAMGRRAAVNGIYAGTARIKVTHPKAAEAAFIVVQVTNFKSMRFGQESADIVVNNMEYIVLETPDYENYTDKVQFVSSNPNTATVIGTHRVILVSANEIGKATITASVPNTDLTASIDINVIADVKHNEPDIVTNQTMFVLSPLDAPFYVNASIIGYAVSDLDSEDLEWTINYTNEEERSPMIKIFPENGDSNRKGFSSKGKSILVEVQRKTYTNLSYCTVTVSHRLTSKKRVLYLQIQEDSKAFTISTKYIQLETGQTAELSCNILNGTSKDYDEVVWTARRDDADPSKDIVRIMGRGKTVNIYGMTDGNTVVTASYMGLNQSGSTCAVTVKSTYYFNLTHDALYVYPGEIDKEGGLFYIQYSVRPANAPIQWLNTDDMNKQTARVTIGPPENKDGTGEGKIYFEFLKEGDFILMGTSNSRMSKVVVSVRDSFLFRFNDGNFFQEVPYLFNEKNNAEGSAIKTNGYQIKYEVIPARASIGLIAVTQNGNVTGTTSTDSIDGWNVYIEKPMLTGSSGIGCIFIKNEKEETAQFTFALYRPDGKPVGTDYNKSITFISRLGYGEGRLVPVFERVSGSFSNSYGKHLGYKYGGEKKNSGYPESDRHIVKTGEYIRFNGNKSNNNTMIDDEYEIDIGDGEEHYIILDKYNKYADIQIYENTGNSPMLDMNNELGGKNRGASSELVDLDSYQGLKALRISGGKDFVHYDRFGSDYDLNLTVSSTCANYDGYEYSAFVESEESCGSYGSAEFLYDQTDMAGYTLLDTPTFKDLNSFTHTFRKEWNSNDNGINVYKYYVSHILDSGEVVSCEDYGYSIKHLYYFSEPAKYYICDQGELYSLYSENLNQTLYSDLGYKYYYPVKINGVQTYIKYNSNWVELTRATSDNDVYISKKAFGLYRKALAGATVYIWDGYEGVISPVNVVKKDDGYWYYGNSRLSSEYKYVIPSGYYIKTRDGHPVKSDKNLICKSNVTLYENKLLYYYGNTPADTNWEFHNNKFTRINASDKNSPIIELFMTMDNNNKYIIKPFCRGGNNNVLYFKTRPYARDFLSEYASYDRNNYGDGRLIVYNFITNKKESYSNGTNTLSSGPDSSSDIPIVSNTRGVRFPNVENRDNENKGYIKIDEEDQVHVYIKNNGYKDNGNKYIFHIGDGYLLYGGNYDDNYLDLIRPYKDEKHYYPLANKTKTDVVKETLGTIIIRYKNGLHEENKLTIKVKHQIRGKPNDEIERKTWTDTAAYPLSEFGWKEWKYKFNFYEENTQLIRLNKGY
jgi:hypothetical protein